SPLKGLNLQSLVFAFNPISDLSPLKGMKLTSLGCNDTKVADLSPLKGMPLMYLSCSNTKVTDLSPLKDVPLKELDCDFKPERDADVLGPIKTLERINRKPVAEFWKEVDGKQPPPPPDGADARIREIAALPADKQVEAVTAWLKERNPGFDG